MIPYGRQDISPADCDAVRAVLESDWLTQGPAVPRFEALLAERCGASAAVAVNSATAALHLACLAVGVGPGDVVWTSPNTFVASANCARYCGADVDFVDVEPDTRNLSVAALADKLARAKTAGRLPKAVIPVHFGGHSCDIAAIGELAAAYGFKVIEDASHAVGGSYRDRPVGSCRWSDVTVFSFHPVKIITTGEGGAALTRDAALANRMARLRSHGIVRDEAEMEGPPHGPWYYEQVELGFNYRLTDIQAALGASQLGRLDDFLAARRRIVAAYGEALGDLSAIALPVERPEVRSGWHLYPIQLTGDPSRRLPLFQRLRERGIGVQVHYIPVHLQPDYRRLGFAAGMFPVAEDTYARTVSLPLHPRLTEGDVARVVEVLREAIAELC